MAAAKNYSEATAVEIDNEIRRIVEENYERARTLLSENMNMLISLSQSLIEKENLTGVEVDEIIAKEMPSVS
jgi:cell division protease FtsH